MHDKEPVVLALDIGTTHCVGATLKNGKPYAIDLGYGKKSVSSNHAIYSDGQFDVGTMDDTAPPTNGLLVTNIKRLIGRRDGQLVNDITNWNLPFEINDEGAAVCRFRGEEIRPEEFYAYNIINIKQLAKDDIKDEVEEYAIAIPAYFGDGQRQSVLDGAKIAGIPKATLINEPTAAIIGHVTSHPETEGELFLVVDIGAGTADVSLVDVNTDRTTFHVKGTSGDSHSGGEEYTYKIVDMVNEKKDHGLSAHALKMACENAKKSGGATIRVRLSEDSFVLKKEDHKKAVKDLLSRLERVIYEAFPQDLRIDDVDHVLMVGGGCWHPLVYEFCQELFGKERVTRPGNLCTLVAEGAALAVRRNNKLQITEVLTQPVGINTQVPPDEEADEEADEEVDEQQGVMKVILNRNESIPCSNSERFKAVHDEETEIRVFSGENVNSSENTFLRSFFIDTIKDEYFIVSLKAEPNEKFTVTVTREKNQEVVKVIEKSPGLSEEEIKILQEKAHIRCTSDSASDGDAGADTGADTSRNSAGSKKRKNDERKKQNNSKTRKKQRGRG
ncbi:Endoplasmic reticulum chaperone BiP [Fusarium oxysporum f. sp. cubense]|uniref:Endoplasmic reticulum chaperone BiP n=1 Tax=Fusarium oxysporum f. sp. cubense TaxID=61366 RepID=A0A559LM81_FUSOC|nr:Endoplasmic reticulum chaperone BiP [Fusarium oxysporum f. sp. cubense]